MIYKTKRWKVIQHYDYKDYKFEEGSERYITGAAGSLDPHQLEHARRENVFTGRFRNLTIGNGMGASALGSGSLATFIGTGPGFTAVQNGFIVAGGSALAIGTAIFTGFGVAFGRKAYREFRARRANLPAGVKQFELYGLVWEILYEALLKCESDEVSHLNDSRQRGSYLRMGERRGGKELATWHIMMEALRKHTDLGVMLDINVSSYLLNTEELVAQYGRSDQKESKRNELKDTIKQVAGREMEMMYARLSVARDTLDIEAGTTVSQYEFEKLATQGDAIIAADTAIETAKATYSL